LGWILISTTSIIFLPMPLVGYRLRAVPSVVEAALVEAAAVQGVLAVALAVAVVAHK